MPNPIPALLPKAYYKADVGTWQDTGGTTPASANTDPIGRWDDQSGNGWHLTQATSGERPTLVASFLGGLPGIRFTAASSQSLANTSISALSSKAAVTIIAIFRNPNLVYAELLGTAAGLAIDIGSGSYYWAIGGNYSYGYDATDGPNTAVSLILRYDGGQATAADQVKVWRSGLPRTLTFPGNPPTPTLGAGNGIQVGRVYPSAAQFFDGEIVEFVILDRALTDPEVASVHAYIAATYFPDLPSGIECAGDSLTVSYSQNTETGGITYPEALATLLGGDWEVDTDGARGTGGGDTAEVGATVARVGQLFRANTRRDIQPYRPRNIVLLWCGTNDMANGTSAATTYAAFLALAVEIAADGWTVVPITVLPRTDTYEISATSAAFEAARAAFNTALRAEGSPPWPFYVDLDTDTAIGAPAASDDTAYYIDQVHMTRAGYGRVAAVVYAAFAAHGYVDSGSAIGPIVAHYRRRRSG